MSTENTNPNLYQLIRGKVSSGHLERILGSSLYRGLVNFQRYMEGTNFDLAELLLKGLGDEALFTEEFQEFIVSNVLVEAQVKGLCDRLNLHFTTAYAARQEILKASKTKLGKALIGVLGLKENAFSEKDNRNEHIRPGISICPDKSKFLSLHDYQRTIKDEIVRNLLEDSRARMLVHMPTGSGKTKTCVEAIIDFLRTRPFQEGIVIWFADSNELCSQAYETLVELWESRGDYPLPVFRIFGENDPIQEILDCKKAVVFVGFQKFRALQRSNKETSVKIRVHLSTNSQLVVIDEAHKSLAETYKNAAEYVSQMPNCRLIGLTATPGRSNNMYDPANAFLSNFFAGNLITIRGDDGEEIEDQLAYLQAKSVLAHIDHRPIEINLDEFNEADLRVMIANKELDNDQIEKIVESPLRNKIIVDEIDNALRDPERDLVLVFACSTNHCILLQKLLEFQGINSEVVLGTTAHHLREKYISDFKAAKLKVLINFGVLTTGFDAPKLKTLIIARHTSSMILYSQMIGRAFRGPLNGGNSKNYVVDLVDNIANLGNPDFLFGYWEEFWGKKFRPMEN